MPTPESVQKAADDLERSIRVAPWRSIDRSFAAIVVGVFAFNFGVAQAIASRPKVWTDDVNLADVTRDRFPGALLPLPKPHKTTFTSKVEAAPAIVRVAKGDGGGKHVKLSSKDLEARVSGSGLVGVIGAVGGLSALAVPELGGSKGMSVEDAIKGARSGKKLLADEPSERQGGKSGDAQQIAEPTTTGGAGARGALDGPHFTGGVTFAPEDEPSVPQSGCDAKAISKVVKRYLSAIQNCYEVESKRRPTLAGRLVVRLTIAPNGRVTEFELDEDGIHSPPMARCIENRFRSWSFPSSARECVVSHPFVFTPAP